MLIAIDMDCFLVNTFKMNEGMKEMEIQSNFHSTNRHRRRRRCIKYEH